MSIPLKVIHGVFPFGPTKCLNSVTYFILFIRKYVSTFKGNGVRLKQVFPRGKQCNTTTSFPTDAHFSRCFFQLCLRLRLNHAHVPPVIITRKILILVVLLLIWKTQGDHEVNSYLLHYLTQYAMLIDLVIERLNEC